MALLKIVPNWISSPDYTGTNLKDKCKIILERRRSFERKCSRNWLRKSRPQIPRLSSWKTDFWTYITGDMTASANITGTLSSLATYVSQLDILWLLTGLWVVNTWSKGCFILLSCGILYPGSYIIFVDFKIWEWRIRGILLMSSHRLSVRYDISLLKSISSFEWNWE